MWSSEPGATCHVCSNPHPDHRVFERGTVLWACSACFTGYVKACSGGLTGPAPLMADWAKALKEKALEVVS